MDGGTAENQKTGMPPGFQQSNMVGSDLTFREKQGENFGSSRISNIWWKPWKMKKEKASGLWGLLW
jgi:hypothetical protein